MSFDKCVKNYLKKIRVKEMTDCKIYGSLMRLNKDLLVSYFVHSRVDRKVEIIHMPIVSPSCSHDFLHLNIYPVCINSRDISPLEGGVQLGELMCIVR